MATRRVNNTRRTPWQLLPALLVVIMVSYYGIYRLNASQAASVIKLPDVSAAVQPVDTNSDSLVISGDQRFASDPAGSIRPNEDFRKACFLLKPKPTCDSEALKAIAAARQGEGLGPLVVPQNYDSLSPTEQIFAVTNIERADRGLPTLQGP